MKNGLHSEDLIPRPLGHESSALTTRPRLLALLRLIVISGLLLVKAALIKGLIVGGLLGAAAGGGRRGGGREGGYRGRRAIDEVAVEPLLASASQRDVDDCAKKLICR
jgi:hypothetical protein